MWNLILILKQFILRIDKIIASQTNYSRKDVKKLISQKKVRVNDEIVKRPEQKFDEQQDTIYIDENKLDMKKHIYLVLNKPQGYISATEDRTAKTVLDLVPEQYMRKHIEKTYRVQIDVDITEEMKEKFKQGIILKDHVCCPATIVVEDKNTALITVTEGKYHQIKRMFGCFGAKVVNLHRISMGGLQLPSDLKEGQCRELTAEELEKVCIRDK